MPDLFHLESGRNHYWLIERARGPIFGRHPLSGGGFMELIDYSIKRKGAVILAPTRATFPVGKITHVLGRNGAGKSTLAKALAGIIPHSGELAAVSGKTVLIGSYSAIPLDLHVKDIIKIASTHGSAATCSELFERLKLLSLDQGKRLCDLSDGQKQKMKLLFFLSSNAENVILDECMSFLDAESIMTISAFLGWYAQEKGATIVNITHDPLELDRLAGSCFALEQSTLIGPMDSDQGKRYLLEGIYHEA